MAHLNYHGRIVARFKAPDSHKRLHLTDKGKVLVTTGPRMGQAKMYPGAIKGTHAVMTQGAFSDYCKVRGYIQEAINGSNT